ncbi:MAG: OmpH family outer membrane protein [Bernardetiaceae bacterium]|nr:OmpH family outer membrane protein [Bernardetiaceae bacterium]
MLLFCFTATAAKAQEANPVKIGYTSAAQVLPFMPDFKQKQNELETYSKQLERELQSQQQDFQAKLKNYEEKANDMPPVLKQQKENELRNMQQNIIEFQQSLQQDLQEKEQKLLQPLYEKVQDAIEKVAAREKYTFVLNAFDGTMTSTILYATEGTDITNLVLKELGIEIPKDKE